MDDKVSEALESCERIDHNARPEKWMSENRASLIHGHTATIRTHIHAQDAELARLRREAARDEQRAEEMQGMLADARAEVERLREKVRGYEMNGCPDWIDRQIAATKHMSNALDEVKELLGLDRDEDEEK